MPPQYSHSDTTWHSQVVHKHHFNIIGSFGSAYGSRNWKCEHNSQFRGYSTNSHWTLVTSQSAQPLGYSSTITKHPIIISYILSNLNSLHSLSVARR